MIKIVEVLRLKSMFVKYKFDLKYVAIKRIKFLRLHLLVGCSYPFRLGLATVLFPSINPVYPIGLGVGIGVSIFPLDIPLGGKVQ